MGFSTEFLMIVFLIIMIIAGIIIANIFGMKKIEKNEKNNKKILSKFRLIMTILYITEIVFVIFNYNFCTCMCGYREFKTIPLLVFIILQFIVDIKFFLLNKDKEYTVNYLIKYIVISIISFGLIIVLSKNDMDKLHSIIE